MSAPDTNVDKQAREHKAPLVGIAGVLTFAGALLVALIIWVVSMGGEPEGADVQVDGRTGQASVVETE
ncbi:hypothetical protein [Litoreibacter albidus]|uniref:Uncharacterized protein n=1 Tax=Litoreibacter albidus TaxID=670155 RepID=A0A1H3B934_9RHOB|nr:hypothetical protein [Litoreibacter albidus]SDX38540.1 hypothetical protein SAMN04488001_3100 [Litoreibacter albidus]